MTPQQKIGANIRALRQRAGMSMHALGEEIGKPKGTISVWEGGGSEIGSLSLHALAFCFGVPMERFFEGVEWGE